MNSFSQTRWQKYDSIYFENLFLPNFSNLLMPKGYVEVLVSNALLTSNVQWGNGNPAKFDLTRRYTYDYVTAIANVGLSDNYRFNAGVELHYARGYEDTDRTSSPLNVFKKSPPGMINREQAFTSIGPRIKWRPFKSNLHFVYTSTVQVPLLNNSDKERFLGSARYYWGNNFLYSFSWGKKVAFFAQDDLYTYFKKNSDERTQYFNAVSLYSFWLVTKHVFPYVSAGYSTLFQRGSSQQFLPVGVGIQYQYSLRFTVNIYYNQYAWAREYNDWRTVNLGLRGVF
jgi:hypothetical protein